MPRNAKVFLVEDDPFLKKVESSWIESDGHKVVLEASSLGEALEKVKLAKEKKVNVGVLDGSLRGKDSPTDGPQVAEELKKAIPEIKIVSFSGDIVVWGDVNPRKPDVSNLGKVVTKL